MSKSAMITAKAARHSVSFSSMRALIYIMTKADGVVNPDKLLYVYDRCTKYVHLHSVSKTQAELAVDVCKGVSGSRVRYNDYSGADGPQILEWVQSVLQAAAGWRDE